MIKEDFIRCPEIGNVIKVYIHDNKFSYGVVVGTAYRQVHTKEGEKQRQIVVLNPIDDRFSDEVDYYLTDNKVLFNEQPQIYKQERITSWSII